MKQQKKQTASKIHQLGSTLRKQGKGEEKVRLVML